MTSRRFAIPELSAYRERRPQPFPWRAVDWQNVLIGAVLVGLPVASIIAALVGWLA